MYVGVVAYVAVGHDEAVVADTCAVFFSRVYATIDDNMFAYHVVVTDMEIGLIGRIPSEVLRIGTYDGTVVEFVVLTHSGAFVDGGEGHDFTSVAYLHSVTDVGKGFDEHIVTDFGGGFNVGQGADF